MKQINLTSRIALSAAGLILLAAGATVVAKHVEMKPVAPSMQGISKGKGVIEHGFYSPMRNKGKVRAYDAPAADAWTRALPDSLMCTLEESDNTTFNPNQTGLYTFNEDTGLVRFLTTSNTSRVRGGLAYGDLTMLWTYKNNASDDNHVWYTRSYNVKKYAAGTLNMSNQKYLSIDDSQDASMIASTMAYDPETGAVFGCFRTADGSGYEFARMDHRFVDAGRSKGICKIDEPWQNCGFTDKGQMYAVLADGKLATVDKSTGATTVVKDLGLAGNDSYAGFLDTRDNLFYIYWSNKEKKEGVLYVVDINNGCNLYKAFTMPFYAKMGAMVSLHNPIKDDAPGLVTNTAVEFSDGGLGGKVTFKAPTATINGQPLSGDLDYTVAAGGKVLTSGKIAPGADGEANITLPEAGNYYVRVRVGNAAGVGLWSIPTKGVWAGPDVPVAPKNVMAGYDRTSKKLTITWDGVEDGVHGGSVVADKVKYSIRKYVNGVESGKVATDLTDKEWSETIDWPKDITTVYYEVVATYEGEDSAGTITNAVTLGTIEAPWKEDFTDPVSLDHFTVYNDGKTASGTGNSTQNVWFRYVNPKDSTDAAAQIYTTSKKNHYLVTPPIHMVPGKSYIFHADASGFASSYEEKVEVLMGKGNAIEDLTTVLVPETSVKAITSNPVVLAKEIMVEEEGEYYIAFHATSATFKRYLQIDNIEVEAPYSTFGPNVVTDLALDGFRYDGSTNVTVSFKAPTIDMQGATLTSMTKIEVERDGQLVKTFRNPTFGETYTFEDACPMRGNYSYKVTAYNSFGGGKYVTGRVETGVDFGAKVTDVVISEPQEGYVTLKWTPATTDVKGREIDPSLIQYSVILNDLYYVGDEFHPNTVNELTFKAVNDGYQGNIYCTIYSYTDAGYNISGSRFDPASYASSVTIPVGKPYDMPIFENGMLAVNWGYDTSGGQWWGAWYPEWSVVAPESSEALGIDTPDGDGWCFAWPVAFNPSYGSEYSSYQDAKTNFYTGKVKVDDSELSALSFQYYVQEPSEDGTPADEYIFYPIVHTTYDGNTALSSPIYTKDATPGWHTVTISLDKYRGQTVQLGFHVEFVGAYKKYNKYFLLDDIQIRQFADHDMMALTLDAPMLEPGEENVLTAGVRNLGYEDAETFVVELFRNNEKVAESDPASLKAGEKDKVIFKQTPGLFWEPLQNYHFNITYDKDQLNYNNASEKVVAEVLSSRLPGVTDLSGSLEDQTVTLTWSAPEIAASITDDCESYMPFAINQAGRWSFIDADGLSTYPIVGNQFEGYGEPSAFVVWENLSEERIFSRSGNKCFAAFPVDVINEGDVNDDWLISPLLNGTAQIVSFWAFGNFGSSLWGVHQIEFLISSTGKEMEDFTRVGDVITLPDAYTKYSFDVPEGTQYFAIRYVQAAVSAIFIDDITFAQFGNSAELEGYDVYCDGEKLNDALLTQPGFTHHTSEGKHTYHVVALYKEGSSDLSNAVNMNVAGVEDIQNVDANVYASAGKIHIDGVVDANVSIVNAHGMIIRSFVDFSGSQVVDVPAGVYMVTIGNKLYKLNVK